MESARLRSWDYGNAGWYFVTICVLNKRCVFGRVSEGSIDLSPSGRIAAEEWQRSEIIRPAVRLDQWIIMPNHLHGIVVIDTDYERPPYHGNGQPANEFGPQRRNLGALIRGFKGAVASRLRSELDPAFAWQSRFHDRIIRSEPQLEITRRYIAENPIRWTARLYRE